MISANSALNPINFSFSHWQIPDGYVARGKAAQMLALSSTSVTRYCRQMRLPEGDPLSIQQFTALMLACKISDLVGGSIGNAIGLLSIDGDRYVEVLEAHGFSYEQFLALLDNYQETKQPLRLRRRCHGGRPRQTSSQKLLRSQARQILGVSYPHLQRIASILGIASGRAFSLEQWHNVYALYSCSRIAKRDRVYGAIAKCAQWMADNDPALSAIGLRADRHGWTAARATTLFTLAIDGETTQENWATIA